MNGETPDWRQMHERGCTLEEFKAALTEEELPNLVDFLRVCHRWADIKNLMNDTTYGEDATSQYNHQQAWVAFEAKRQQQIAALSPIFQNIILTFRKIWWIADVHYPYHSQHVADANMCFTGDGLGLAYFNVESAEGDGTITLVLCDDEEFNSILSREGIIPGVKIDGKNLLRAVEKFVVLINGKFERFSGQEAVGHLNQ
jgi:hypothetical protein